MGLAEISSRDDIIQMVAESLGLGLSSSEDRQTQLLTYLANKRQLLVFDNFEHLADGAPIVSAILRAAPEVTVMATSRAKLNLTGETVLTLGGLETVWDTPEAALGTSGVQLFIDAAQHSQPGLMLKPDDLSPLAEILRLTGGMPLAILLAAAWVDMLSVTEIAAEIAANLDFLETDTGDIPDRHRSVRSAFDYSWKLLGPEERSIFAALSIFRGGFTREAADVVAGASLRNLATLSNKSLVTASRDTGRYTVHELLRQYAEAELQKQPDQYHRVLEKHAAYYSGLTEEACALLPQSDQPLMLATIEQDLDNIRLAWRHCLRTQDAAGVRRMATGLWFVYEIRGWYQAAVGLFNEALDAFDENSRDETTVIARALTGAVQAWFLVLLGRQDEGAAAAEAATIALRAAGDSKGLWIALQCWALGLVYLGRVEQWIAVAEEGMALGKTLDGPFWEVVFKNWRGGAALMTGDPATGGKLLVEAMEVYQKLDEQYWMSLNLGHQATGAISEGRLEDAIDLFSRSVERGRRLGALRAIQYSLTGLGDANAGAGKLEAAETAFVEGIATSEQMGLVREMLAMITKVARIRAATGDEREAVEILATILAEPSSAEHPIGMFESTTIAEAASAAMEDLQKELDPDEFSSAHAAGTSRPYDVVAKELIESRATPRHGSPS